MDPRALQAAAAAAAAVASSGGSSGMVLDEATKNAMQYFLSQQYSIQQQPQATNVNDTFNLTQNALASGIPTLHQPTVMSYLGYSNSLQSNSKEQNFPAKYLKLLEVIEEIGKHVVIPAKHILILKICI